MYGAGGPFLCRRASLLVRAKSLPLVTLQTAAGISWFVGFAVRNGVSGAVSYRREREGEGREHREKGRREREKG